MKSLLELPKNNEAIESAPDDDLAARLAVLQELDEVLSGRTFKHADRCKQFLRYVVLSKLDGHTERLKERTIGTEVFQRPPGYATGEDPVVRVQAGEVRRRLEQHYQEMPQPPRVRIELPVGSYAPVFHWPAKAGAGETDGQTPSSETSPAPGRMPHSRIIFLAAAILAVVGVTALVHSLLRASDAQSVLDQFWGPAIASHQPILICLANASDRPGTNIQELSSQAQLNAAQAGPKAIRTSLPVERDESPAADPASVSPEIVPAADASVAVALSGLFGRVNRPSQLRIGAAATYEDLRDFPAAIIGGFNNKWTMQLVSNLHFAFIWAHGQYMIREQVPDGKVWTTRLGPQGETLEDFAIVARLINSKTGQFTVTVAGIGPRGTEAAGEFVTSSRDLEDGLARAPAGWQNRNLEVLLQTTVTDSVAGPPHVIGTFAW
ncbi:MAG TPA: hypothetical protein VGS10_12955 [Terracidiphilus sp.]|nr:hypothetical protein [Terracidiphilus sp.]